MKFSKYQFIAGMVITGMGIVVAASQGLSLDEVIKQLGNKTYSVQLKESEDNQINESVFRQYCVGDLNKAEVIPQPNYDNSLVKLAAQKLSDSKIQADKILKNRADAELDTNLPTANENVTKLKSSKIAEVTAVAATIESQIQNNGKSVFNEAMKPSLNAMALSYFNYYLPALEKLKVNLDKELRSVDTKVLSTNGPKLEAGLKKELKSIDLKMLRSLNRTVNDGLSAEMPSHDSAKFKKYMLNLKAQIKDQTDTYLKEASNSIEQMKDYLGTNDIKVLRDNVLGNMSTLDYYFELSEAKLPETLKNVRSELNAFTLVMKAQSSVLLTASFREKIKNPEKAGINNIKYLADEIKNLLTDDKVLEFVKKSELKTAIASYLGEIAKFQVNDILININEVNKLFAQGNFDSAYWRFDNIVEGIKSTNSKLSAETEKILNQMRTERAFANSEEIKSNLQNAINSLTTNPAPKALSDDIYYTISSALNNLTEEINFSGDTKEQIKSLKIMADEFAQLYSLNNIVNQAVNLAESGHFYFYGGIKKLYKLSDKKVPQSVPVGTLPVAHNFLTQLCGEFRDRATMIEAKLKWIENMYTLPAGQQKGIDPSKNIWSQVTADAYGPYLSVASNLWEARRESLPRYINVPNGKEKIQVDNPVPPTTVCETKFIFAEYISRNLEFDSLKEFNNGNSKHIGLEAYKAITGNCNQDDLVDYYDFRGDSNFKHYSPESNGMIWAATSVASNCETPVKAKQGQTVFTDADCENYFKNPFTTRFNSARAGLATWLYRDEKHASTFSTQGKMVAIYPQRKADQAPFSFSFDVNNANGDIFDFDPEFLKKGDWSGPDIGFNNYVEMNSEKADLGKAYARIRDAVDRHTDWYSSGYNDRTGTIKEQAYSPFVASSYVMSASDGFTSCGATVQCPPDGLKRWMFVFRVKPQNWYTPEKLVQKTPVNFESMWFDETSFGVSGLADSEKAWDRLGTSFESEMDSILYLINVPYSGENYEGGE